MSAPITYTDLAELAEAMNLRSAAHLRESADDEAALALADARTAQGELEWVFDLLDKVPDSTPSTKHSDTCWQRHARCLADRLLEQS